MGRDVNKRYYKVRRNGNVFVLTVPTSVHVFLDLEEGDDIEYTNNEAGYVELRKVQRASEVEEAIENTINQYKTMLKELDKKKTE